MQKTILSLTLAALLLALLAVCAGAEEHGGIIDKGIPDGIGFPVSAAETGFGTVIPANMNADNALDSDDAIYLLRYTLNPIRYPITQSGDVNGDGHVDSDDAIYLLRHTLNPGRYPLYPSAADAPKYRIVVDFYDRDDLTVYTETTTLGRLLQKHGITLEEGEVPSVDLWNDRLNRNMTIKVDKYVYKSEDVNGTVPHTEEKIEVDTIPRGTVNILTEGQDGESILHYTVTYKNGVEIDRSLE